MDIIGTGLSGLVGSRVTKLLSSSFTFKDLSKETKVDITDIAMLEEKIGKSSCPWVFHFAAFTDVEGAEKQKNEGSQSTAYKINVKATSDIVGLCRKTGKRLLYISTDYIFDGTQEEYAETDEGNPISFYGKTKYEGEQAVRTLGDMSLVLRISTPYRPFPVGKIDFMHKILSLLKEGKTVTAPSDQWFSPTYIDDLALVIDSLVKNNHSGVVHVPAKIPITPFEAALEIARLYSFPSSLVCAGSYEAYYENRAKAPKQARLRHDTIDRLGLSIHSFGEGIASIFREES
jgi:dTDP-4-dehydrorhamnose reductase